MWEGVFLTHVPFAPLSYNKKDRWRDVEEEEEEWLCVCVSHTAESEWFAASEPGKDCPTGFFSAELCEYLDDFGGKTCNDF